MARLRHVMWRSCSAKIALDRELADFLEQLFLALRRGFCVTSTATFPGPCGSCGRTGLRLLSHRKAGRHRWPARRLRVASPLRQCRLCSGIGPSRACTSTRSSAPALSAGSSRRSNRCERSTKRHRSMVTKTWRQPALQALGSRHKSRIRRAATFSPRLRPAITAGIANGPRSTPAVFEYVAVLRLPE